MNKNDKESLKREMNFKFDTNEEMKNKSLQEQAAQPGIEHLKLSMRDQVDCDITFYVSIQINYLNFIYAIGIFYY